MRHRIFTLRSFALLGAIAPMAYSGSALPAAPVEGLIEISFYVVVPNTPPPFNLQLLDPPTLPVCIPMQSCQAPVIGARVTDSSELPAQGGAVQFQYCAVRTQGDADEAPLEACEAGLGMWRNLIGNFPVLDGNVFVGIGAKPVKGPPRGAVTGFGFGGGSRCRCHRLWVELGL
jgi:hypothetical protein